MTWSSGIAFEIVVEFIVANARLLEIPVRTADVTLPWAISVKKWGAKNVERMKRGRAPQKLNDKTLEVESRELHHPTPRRQGGKEVIEVWPDEHAAIDPHRRLKK